MSELISRQAAIDYFVTNVGFNDEDGYLIEDECELRRIWTDIIEGIPPEPDAISRQAAIDAIGEKSDEIYKTKQKGATYPHDDFFQGMAYAENVVKKLPPVQLGTNLAEEYARAVRNWLVNYQVKCADLAGRYTPYEVLGWIVSDWRKENGIW